MKKYLDVFFGNFDEYALWEVWAKFLVSCLGWVYLIYVYGFGNGLGVVVARYQGY